jgi:hypothetical protein
MQILFDSLINAHVILLMDYEQIIMQDQFNQIKYIKYYSNYLTNFFFYMLLQILVKLLQNGKINFLEIDA